MTTTQANADLARPMKINLAAPPYYVKGLALGVPAYLIGIHLWTWVFMLPTFLGGRADFRQLYTAGYMVRSGHAHQLYDYGAQLYFQNTLVSQHQIALPFIRPAFEALLFVPFSFLSFQSAYLTFLALNVVLLSASFLLIRGSLEQLHVYRWFPAVLFLAFLPAAAALMQGQDSILLLLLLTGAFLALKSDHECTAGVLLGLGTFKFQIIIPILLLFSIWKRKRFVLGCLATALMLAAFSIAIAGISQTSVYLHSLLAPPYPLPLNLMPNLRGLTFGLLGSHVSASLMTVITLSMSALVIVWVARSKPKRTSEAFLVAMPTSCLVSYYLLIHDLSILLLSILIVLNRFIGSESAGNLRGRLTVRSAALLFVAPALMSWAPSYFFLASLPLLLYTFVSSNSFCAKADKDFALRGRE